MVRMLMLLMFSLSCATTSVDMPTAVRKNQERTTAAPANISGLYITRPFAREAGYFYILQSESMFWIHHDESLAAYALNDDFSGLSPLAEEGQNLQIVGEQISQNGLVYERMSDPLAECLARGPVELFAVVEKNAPVVDSDYSVRVASNGMIRIEKGGRGQLASLLPQPTTIEDELKKPARDGWRGVHYLALGEGFSEVTMPLAREKTYSTEGMVSGFSFFFGPHGALRGAVLIGYMNAQLFIDDGMSQQDFNKIIALIKNE